MAQRSLMYYAYFRFYIDEDTIEAGLNSYCTGWEHMFEVGYNYKEYKCYVDNLGGFEHFVGDMRGYISQTRETGFLDGSPSDSIYDSSLLMGSQKVTDDNFLILNGVKRESKIYFRKMTAQDAGTAHKVKISAGSSVINHPVMYVLDSSQIEIFEPKADITDDSDVDSYEFTADIATPFLTGVVESITCPTISDFNNMFDLDKTTYARIETTSNVTCELIIDMQVSFSAIAIDFHHWYNVGGRFTDSTTVYTSPDKSAWTSIGSVGFADGRYLLYDNNVDGRYVKIVIDPAGANVGRVDVYRLMVS